MLKKLKKDSSKKKKEKNVSVIRVFRDPEPSFNQLDMGAAPPPLRSPQDDLVSFSSLSMDTPGTPATPTSALGSSLGSHSQQSAVPNVYYHSNVPLNPMPLHNLQGRNVRIGGEDRRVAARLESEYCNSLIFSNRPMKFGETIVIQVLSVDRSYMGGLGFGLTACNPSDVDPSSLPDDSDYLLDRLEYWVVNKDVCSVPEVGDELSFFLSVEGEVRYSRNSQPPVTLMHVDRTLPLWVFFDVYGNIQKIKILGCTMSPIQGRLSQTCGGGGGSSIHNSGAEGGGVVGGGGSGLSVAMPSTQGSRRQPGSMLPPAYLSLRSNSEPEDHNTFVKGSSSSLPSSLPATPSVSSENVDCHVCYEREVDCVIYKCGHMCLCFTCANQIKQQKGLCPICRNQITDLIKVYRS